MTPRERWPVVSVCVGRGGVDLLTNSNEFVSMAASSGCVCMLPISRMVSVVVDHTAWITSCDHSSKSHECGLEL